MNKNLIIVFLVSVLTLFCFVINSFAFRYIWAYDKDGELIVYDEDTQIKNKVILEDFDDDGVAYYYYIDDKGHLLKDTICPDYFIVDKAGRRLNKFGDPEQVVTKVEEDKVDNNSEEYVNNELYQLAMNEKDNSYSPNDDDISVGAIRMVENTSNGFGPNLFITPTQSSGEAKSIVGKGVVFKKKEDKDKFDTTLKREVKEYITGGNAYSKSVNGTTFGKAKWKAVMALKGTGAYIDFENPKNNFNKISGQVATHNFTYSDRETKCTLTVYDQSNEELYTTSDFNYNNGCKFNFVFPRKTTTLRFELLVDGQYTTRVAYLRELKYGFNRMAWRDEMDQDEEDAIINAAIKEGANELIVETEDEQAIDDDTNVDEEGYTKAERAQMALEASLSNARRASSSEPYDEDEDDEDDSEIDPDNLKASEKDKTSGPSFDKALQDEAKKKANYGPGFVGLTIDDGNGNVTESTGPYIGITLGDEEETAAESTGPYMGITLGDDD